MASTSEELRLSSLVLSAQEIRNLTGWDDPMIEDYLAILRNLIMIASQVDETTMSSDNSLQLNALNLGQIGKLQATTARQRNMINNLMQLTTDINKVRTKTNNQEKGLKRIEQLAVGW